jgi:hypothetical protein
MNDTEAEIRRVIESLVESSPEPPVLDETGFRRAAGLGREPGSSGSPRDPVPPSPSVSSHRGWVVALTAMGAALVLIGGIAALVRWGLDSGGRVPGLAFSPPPHVLIPLEEARARSAVMETAAAEFSAAYESGTSRAVLEWISPTVVREDSIFPSLLPSRDLVERIFFPGPSFSPVCNRTGHFSAFGEGLYVAECSKWFGYDFPQSDLLTQVSYWSLGPIGRIERWILHYELSDLTWLPDLEWAPQMPNDAEGARVLLEDYAAAWSSHEAALVTEVYAPDARRVDSLLDRELSGDEAIRGYAADFFLWYPESRWALAAGFMNLDGGVGGIFRVTTPGMDGEPCDVGIAVLMEHANGMIIEETVFYDVGSLLECGWSA